MTKGTKRNYLTPDDIAVLIRDWEKRTMTDWAKYFNVSYQSITKLVKEIREQDAALCPARPRRKRSRKELVTEAIRLIKD